MFLRLSYYEEMDRVKSELLTVLAHETRTPLSGVIAPAEYLVNEDDMNKEERKQLGQMILDSGRQLLGFFEKVILLYQLRNVDGLNMQDAFEVEPLVDAAILSIQESAQRRNVTIKPRLDDGVFALPGDQTKLRYCLQVLLENAVEHSPEGATVEVLVSTNEDDITFQITDHGCGVPPGSNWSPSSEFSSCDIVPSCERQRLESLDSGYDHESARREARFRFRGECGDYVLAGTASVRPRSRSTLISKAHRWSLRLRASPDAQLRALLPQALGSPR